MTDIAEHDNRSSIRNLTRAEKAERQKANAPVKNVDNVKGNIDTKEQSDKSKKVSRGTAGRLRKGSVLNPIGRPKGQPNVFSGQAKENIAKVFEGMNGIEGMLEWAQEHKTEFYSRVYPRLIPLMVQGHIETVHKSELATSALERIITGILANRQPVQVIEPEMKTIEHSAVEQDKPE